MTTYKEFHQYSIEKPDQFWTEQAALIDWKEPFTQVCDYSRPPFAKWFVGGKTNLCHNAVDRHAAKRPDAATAQSGIGKGLERYPRLGQSCWPWSGPWWPRWRDPQAHSCTETSIADSSSVSTVVSSVASTDDSAAVSSSTPHASKLELARLLVQDIARRLAA